MGEERRAWMRGRLAATALGSLLDVGAGRGETLEAAAALGFAPLAGTEVVAALLGGVVIYGEAHALPFGDAAFDVVTCFDVMEHLLPADQTLALRELARVTRRELLVTAADYPHEWDGVELHVGRRDSDAWDALIRAHCPGRVERLGWCGSAEGWRVVLAR